MKVSGSRATADVPSRQWRLRPGLTRPSRDVRARPRNIDGRGARALGGVGARGECGGDLHGLSAGVRCAGWGASDAGTEIGSVSGGAWPTLDASGCLCSVFECRTGVVLDSA